MPAMLRLPRIMPFLVALLLIPAPALGQGGQAGEQEDAPPPVNQSVAPLHRGFTWRSIGPVGQGGRIDDVEAVESNPSIYYLGYATGGLWKTVNNGTTFESIFDTYSTHSIGDLAIAPSNPDILYVGTGEPNNRQSSSFGDGMYKSTDAGATFTQIGLRETQSISRVVVHPTNPDIVWVAAIGRLFGPNPERGVFKTTDGGGSWTKVLYQDENTGATDLVVDVKNPDVLYAATYTRQRTAYGFASGGPNVGIWKSTDGGQNWTRLTGNGLPNGTMGRIGLAISRSNPNVVYAQIEVAPDKESIEEQPQPQAGGGGFGGGGGRGQSLPPDPQVSGVWRSTDAGATWEFMSNQNNRPMYYSQIRVDPQDERVVWTGGSPAFKSTDGGATFEQMQGMGHVDHHGIWIDPNNGDHVIYGNDGSLDVTWDGGATWESIRLWAVGQPYHVSVDMRRPYYVCTGLQDNGSWCGPSSVRTGSILAEDWYGVGGGDGFYTQVDPTDWTVMYSESQDGNISRLDLRSGSSQSIRPRAPGTGRGGGGGGAAGAAIPSNVQPVPPEGTRFRFNWNSPMLLSPHNPSMIYYGGNRLFISRDRGTTWTMTQDLTRDIDRDQRSILGKRLDMPNCGRARVGACINSRNDGISSYSTIITVAESPIIPGVLWVGTDDGLIQVSRDGGASWAEVAGNLPGGSKEYYVSRVEASYFDPATAYASVDGHKSDDLKPYVYVTRDYGTTWTEITNDLPAMGNVNTIRQDPKNKDLLYVGTEFGFFISHDEGQTWKKFMTNLPVVRIDDVVVHPRDNDLVLATHGRSVWIMDDITALQQLTPEVMAEDAALLQPREAVLWSTDLRQRRAVTGSKNFEGQNAPQGTAIAYYLKNASNSVELTITDLATGELFRSIETSGDQGLNRIQWDLCSDQREVQPGQAFGGFGGGGGGCGGGGRGGAGGQGPRMVAVRAGAGLYKVTLKVNGTEHSKTVSVVEDTWMTM